MARIKDYEKSCIYFRLLVIVVASGGFVGVGAETKSGNNAGEVGRDLLREIRNKEIVFDFYYRLFGERDLSAIEEYVAPDLIQHNPNLADGKEGYLTWASKQFPPGTPPNKRLFIERAAAEGDLVWIHALNNVVSRAEPSSDDAVVDIYRLKDGLLVEHFDVVQPVPLISANPHPMFQSFKNEYQQQCEFVRN